MQLKGTNFQPWAEFDLDISGLTVLVGPSNKGKSAIFRALKGLFRNELPASLIRYGSDGLELGVKWDGHTIVARRAPKDSTTYQIDGGKELTKLNQAIPPELKKFGMNEVEIGEFTVDPIFTRQGARQFMLDPEGYSQMEVNTILGAFASTEKLEFGKKAANLEIAHKNSEAKTLAGEIIESKQREADLEIFAREAQTLSRAVGTLQTEIGVLEVKIGWILAVRARLAQLQPLKEALANLVVPDTAEIQRLASGFDYAVLATNNFRLGRIYKRTADAAQAAWESFREAATLYNAIMAIEGVLKLKPQVFSLETLRSATDVIWAEASSLDKSARNLSQGIIKLGELAQLQSNVSSLKQWLKQADEDIREVKARISNLERAQNLVTCPQCKHRFDSRQEPEYEFPEDYEVN